MDRATDEARRVRAAGLSFSAALLGRVYRDVETLGRVSDDQAILAGLMRIWARSGPHIREGERIFQLGVVLVDLHPGHERQLSLLSQDDDTRQRWETITGATDALNQRYGKTAISLGPWPLRSGELAGGKIAFTRIPAPEDFW